MELEAILGLSATRSRDELPAGDGSGGGGPGGPLSPKRNIGIIKEGEGWISSFVLKCNQLFRK